MIVEKLKTENDLYKFRMTYDFWANPVIEVIKNDVFIGHINSRYTIDEARNMIKKNVQYQDAIIY